MPSKHIQHLAGRDAEYRILSQFVKSDAPNATLGILWGRRRIGKTALLRHLTASHNGFYHQAIRGSSSEALGALADDLSAFLKLPAPLALSNWPQAIETLLGLASEKPMPIVLDEFPYLLEHSPGLDSIIQRVLEVQAQSDSQKKARLILCGSSIGVMSKLRTGTAPLRGRSGLDLKLSPFDFRNARVFHGLEDLPAAVATFSVIGGVAAYAREMTGNDLPKNLADFNRWIMERVLSPGQPLLGEMDLLLSEDPETARSRKINLYHSTLAAVANGHHTWSSITKYVGISGSSLQSIMDTLIASDLVTRLADPLKANRALYTPADPFLRFHYALIRRNPNIGRTTGNAANTWTRLEPTFRSLVLGPCFEWMAREWTAQFAPESVLHGTADLVGSSAITGPDRTEMELDIVATTDGADLKAEERTVLAIGEAKVSKRLSVSHLRRLETARALLGERASQSKLFLFGTDFEPTLLEQASSRHDVELIDLVRLYGSRATE